MVESSITICQKHLLYVLSSKLLLASFCWLLCTVAEPASKCTNDIIKRDNVSWAFIQYPRTSSSSLGAHPGLSGGFSKPIVRLSVKIYEATKPQILVSMNRYSLKA